MLFHSNRTENPTESINIQTIAVLKQNQPNPLKNTTIIEYELPGNISTASLVIYDLEGKEMDVFSIFEKGSIEYDASNLENGIYVYAIVANGKILARQKMVVQR